MLPTVTIYQAKICCMLHIKSSKALDLHNIWLRDLWDMYEATNWRVDEQAVSFKISCILSQFDCLDDHGCGEWNDHSHQMPPLVGTEIIPTSIVIRVIAVVIVIMIFAIVIMIFVTNHVIIIFFIFMSEQDDWRNFVCFTSCFWFSQRFIKPEEWALLNYPTWINRICIIITREKFK